GGVRRGPGRRRFKRVVDQVDGPRQNRKFVAPPGEVVGHPRILWPNGNSQQQLASAIGAIGTISNHQSAISNSARAGTAGTHTRRSTTGRTRRRSAAATCRSGGVSRQPPAGAFSSSAA